MSIGREATEIGSVVYEIECRNIGKGRGMKVIIEGQETKGFLTFSRMRKTKIVAVARRTSTKRGKKSKEIDLGVFLNPNESFSTRRNGVSGLSSMARFLV